MFYQKIRQSNLFLLSSFETGQVTLVKLKQWIGNWKVFHPMIFSFESILVQFKLIINHDLMFAILRHNVSWSQIIGSHLHQVPGHTVLWLSLLKSWTMPVEFLFDPYHSQRFASSEYQPLVWFLKQTKHLALIVSPHCWRSRHFFKTWRTWKHFNFLNQVVTEDCYLAEDNENIRSNDWTINCKWGSRTSSWSEPR